MKKRISSIISLILASLLVLCACAGNEGEAIATTPAITLPEDRPTRADKVIFCDTPLNSEFITVNDRATMEIVEDRAQGEVLKLTLKESDKKIKPSIRIQYGKYMELCGLEPISWNDFYMAVLYIKLEGTYDAKLNVNVNSDSNIVHSASGSGSHRDQRLNWQYVTVPLPHDENEGTLDDLIIGFMDDCKAGDAIYIDSITFVKDSQEALKVMGLSPIAQIRNMKTEIEIEGLQNEYTFLQLTDLHMCAIGIDDKEAMRPARYNYAAQRRNDFKYSFLYSEERLRAFYTFAEKNDVDLMIMTGDILDFPSKENVRILYNEVTNAKTPTLFTLGNHDWSFKDDYHTPNATNQNIPLFAELSDGDPLFAYVEYEDLIVASIDNSRDYVTDETVDKFLALYEKNKPIILTLHVPLYSEKLAEKSIAQSGKNLTMGGEGMHSDKEAVMRLYNAVCVDENTPVVAVLSGHLHYDFEDVFENGVPQYVTWQGYVGGCRTLTVKGK